MGILRKDKKSTSDKPVRPFQDVGVNDSIRWYTDINETLVDSYKLFDFQEYVSNIYLYTEMPTFKDIGMIDGYVDTKNVIKSLKQDVFSLWLVYLNLPESVENILIAQFKDIKKERANLDEKVNQKRKRLL